MPLHNPKIKTIWNWFYTANVHTYGSGFYLHKNGLIYSFHEEWNCTKNISFHENFPGIDNASTRWGIHAFPSANSSKHLLENITSACVDVRWMNCIQRCIVCGTTNHIWSGTHWKEQEEFLNGLKENDDYRGWQENEYYEDSQQIEEKLKIKGNGTPLKIFCHEHCNPRNRGTGVYVQEFGNKFLNVSSKCWPSFARIQKEDRAYKILEAEQQRKMTRRIVQSWAVRHPPRVSTKEARNFFKIHFGIQNIASFIKTIP